MDVVVPDGTGWLGIGIAFVVAFFLSFLWWGPLFGKKWATEMGMDMDEAPPMAKPLLLQAAGTALFVYVLWNVMHAFTVSVDHANPNQLMLNDISWSAGFMGAFFTWLGFFVPAHLGRAAWEKASWTLVGINLAGHLVVLFALSIVFILV
ncbi:MAG: DUF1761 domain-containing protein [Thermoplasmatota archaeon]